MVEIVKDFIEYNIDIIDQGKWDELFLNWYAYRHDYYFDDMMEILEVALPDIWKQTWESRARMLRELATHVFGNLSNRNKRITFKMISQELNSSLGFEGQDLIDVLDQAAKQAGLHKATNGWFRI